jgi:D-3-phosphoglycerate dehydrogenase
MNVLITDKTHPVLTEKLEAAGHQCRVWTDCTYQSLLEQVKEYDAIVVRSKIIIDRNFVDHARHLKCIGRVGAGMETIDVDYAESVGIRCLNSPEGNRDAVGEHATGLLLALFDKIAAADAEVRNGLWQREANRGLEVKGKTVGIIGCGNMGGAFAQRLQGFECKIIAYDKYKPAGYAPSYVEEVSLEELQEQADIVSLHVPLTDETHYMVDEVFIERMHRPFYLINTSRGAVVKTVDLAAAIEQGKVLGAALDVIEYENMSKDGIDIQSQPADFRYLLSSPHTVLTPHIAGWTVESKYKLAAVLADKIIETLC